MKKSNRKNILMIMCDQLNFNWLSCAGTDYVETPNIDSIADNGMMFNRAVCNSPVCAPSRISLAGGLYPHRLGTLDNFTVYPLGQQPTYYEKLRTAGYRVGVVGKTDLHKADHYNGVGGDTPFMYQLGFTDPINTEGKMHAMKTLDFRWNPKLPNESEREPLGPYQVHLMSKGNMGKFAEDYYERQRNLPMWYASESVIPMEDYHDSYIGRNACNFIETISEESPWHLFVSFVGPHDPWDAPKEYFEMYKDKQFPPSVDSIQEGKPEWIKKRMNNHSGDMSQEECNLVKQHYAGMIKHIDDWVGRILETLDKRGSRENTTIIFAADHGEMMGSHGLFQKRVMYEESVRVPLIISDPDFLQGIKSDALVELVDLYPTILDVAKVDYDTTRLDGKSLVPVLEGRQDNHKDYQVSEIVHGKMIFDGRYKFIENINDINELYDLLEDSDEQNNIIETNKKLAKDLNWKLKKIMAGVK